MLAFTVIVFLVSLFTLVKGADLLISGAEKIGSSFGMPKFMIGVLIIGIGTSFPELVAGIAALMQNQNEIVAANAVGSNIANILLVIGVSGAFARKLSVTKDLIETELPVFVIATILFLGVAIDGNITFLE